MQDYELGAYLGEFEATDEQREALLRASDLIDARYPDPDRQHSAQAAFTAAYQVIVGDDTLEQIAGEWRRARAVEREAMERLTGAIAGSASTGVFETTISERAGVDRQTVRKALGK